jgi:multiple sugar transport system ATP-binding protein
MTMGDRIVILKDGELQQNGAPTDVYRNPANEFVGGFVGSPSMNFLGVGIETSGSRVALVADSGRFEYELTDEHLSEAVRDEETATLGVRPEDVYVVEDGSDGIETTVEVVEPVGSDNYLHLDVGDDFIARVAADIEPATGERIRIGFDADDLHLFHADSGESLLVDRQSRLATA